MSARLSMSSSRRTSSVNWTDWWRSGNRKGPARSSRTPSLAKSWQWPRGRLSIRTIRRHSRRRCGKTGPWPGCTSRVRRSSPSWWPGALERGLIGRDDEIDCGDGEMRLGSRLLHDTHPYGRLNVTDVLVKSSNIGMSQIGARLSNEQLNTTILSFGFGRPTGSGLSGEIAGMLRPVKEWSSYSNASLSMGQELGVTPLQMICAHSALANGGTWISPNSCSRPAKARSATAMATCGCSQHATSGVCRQQGGGPLGGEMARRGPDDGGRSPGNRNARRS